MLPDIIPPHKHVTSGHETNSATTVTSGHETNSATTATRDACPAKGA